MTIILIRAVWYRHTSTVVGVVFAQHWNEVKCWDPDTPDMLA